MDTNIITTKRPEVSSVACLKIKVLQYMYGNCGYFPYSEWINRRYCERHGYEYVLRRDKPRPDRHICWHKVPVIIDELHSCDYLLFLDADAVFYCHELTIENEIIPELKDKLVLMAQDCGNETLRWHPGLPNSGVILVKVVDTVFPIFSDWNDTSNHDEETRWTWPPEQMALWRHVLPKHEKQILVLGDYFRLQGQFGQHIRHYCLSSEEHRISNMRSVYQRLTHE